MVRVFVGALLYGLLYASVSGGDNFAVGVEGAYVGELYVEGALGCPASFIGELL